MPDIYKSAEPHFTPAKTAGGRKIGKTRSLLANN
jgi:hypothetical protein